MRRYPHRPWFHKAREWPRDAAGRAIRQPKRREHRLLSRVKATPSALSKAKSRSRLYMHAADRRRQIKATA